MNIQRSDVNGELLINGSITGSIMGKIMKNHLAKFTLILLFIVSLALPSFAAITQHRTRPLDILSNKIPAWILDKVARRSSSQSGTRRWPSKQSDIVSQSPSTIQSSGPLLRSAEATQEAMAPAWSHQYASGLAPAEDAATATVSRSGGYIFVTGYSTDANTGTDYFTAKYDSTGARIWTARYDDPQHGDDVAMAIALDSSGNVYVTGKSNGFGTAWDIVTVKYDTLGIQQWTARYNGSANGDDAGVAVAVDASQNIYVGGNSASQSSFTHGDSYNDDIVLVKYSSAGAELWNARKNGAANGTDRASAMAIDGIGNVFIAGATENLGSYDYYILKYTTAGALNASAVYDGPANGNDRATAIKTDAGNNVYVTGSSAGSGTSDDYLTIKYNNALVKSWEARYNGTGGGADGAVALALDASSNVYVTGWSDGIGTSTDITTVKYSSGGVQRWAARYDGAGNDLDVATGITVFQNAIYVTGWSFNGTTADDFTTIKYDSAGAKQWSQTLDGSGNAGDYPNGIAVDDAGSVYAVGLSDGGSTGNDFDVVKYTSGGVQKWNDRFNGPGNSFERATAVTVDNSGNTYVTGQSDGLLTLADFVTAKYDADGNQMWVARYNGAGGTYDYATAIAVDNTGNVYVTGYSDADYLTVKYDATGAEQWTARYNGPGNSTDFATAIAVNGNGFVYVTGRSYGSGSSYDYATIKYDAATGDALWIRRYDGPGNASDYASAIAVDGSGNAYVTGTSGAYPDDDFATVMYNSGGVEQWVSRYDGPGNSDDQAVAIGVQSSGKVIVSGSSFGSGGSYDFATIAYNSSDGGFAWLNRYDGAANSADFVSAMKVTTDDNIVITGSSGTGSSLNYATVKLDASGNRKWATEFNGSGNDADAASAVAVNSAGEIFVTGYSYRTKSLSDIATVKYSPSGVEQWVARYDAPSGGSDAGVAVAITPSQDLIVAGYSSGVGSSAATVIKYPAYATTLSLVDGWNMISIPRTLADYRTAVLFPTAISKAFAYASSTYLFRDTLQNGVGYWIRMASPATISIPGQPRTLDTISLESDWNLVGSSTEAIPTSSITSIPGGIVMSVFYGYDGSTYFPEDTLKPGQAYWVRTSALGKIILSSSAAVPLENRIRIVPTADLPPAPPGGKTTSSSKAVPTAFALEQNSPNPFNPSTRIQYSLPENSIVSLKVYNMLGQIVTTLLDAESQSSGYKQMEFDAASLPSGLYFYQLSARTSDRSATTGSSFIMSRKMILMK